MLKGYTEIGRMTYDECIEALRTEADEEVLNMLQERLAELDDASFVKCTTAEDWQAYISKFPYGSHREEAAEMISRYESELEEATIKACKKISDYEAYLNHYPNGRFRDEAKESIRIIKEKNKSRRRRRIIWCMILAVVLVVICYKNYHPVTYFNYEANALYNKTGGTRTISLSTDALTKNIKILSKSSVCESWLCAKMKGRKLLMTADTNFCSGERIDAITVRAYSSFFGLMYGGITRKISATQYSGLPTFLTVGSQKVIIDKYGKSGVDGVRVKTDGLKLDISTSSSWLSSELKKEFEDGNLVGTISFKANVNEEGSRYADVVIKCGDYSKYVYVFQESGLATRFNLDRTSLSIPEKGTEEGTYYPITVDTDGTSWTVKSSPSWLTVNSNIPRRRLEIESNVNKGKIRTGVIEVASNNGMSREISVTQNGDPTNFGTTRSSCHFGTDRELKYVDIQNNSSKSLSVSDDRNWLSASVINDNRISISCSSNYDDPPRTGIVTVRCGTEETSITVRQDGWETCPKCNGKGERDCPNYYKSWSTEFGAYSYIWVNNTHTLRRLYTVWQYGMPVPACDDKTCEACGGDGRIECSKCNGYGKIVKTNY